MVYKTEEIEHAQQQQQRTTTTVTFEKTEGTHKKEPL